MFITYMRNKLSIVIIITESRNHISSILGNGICSLTQLKCLLLLLASPGYRSGATLVEPVWRTLNRINGT